MKGHERGSEGETKSVSLWQEEKLASSPAATKVVAEIGQEWRRGRKKVEKKR